MTDIKLIVSFYKKLLSFESIYQHVLQIYTCMTLSHFEIYSLLYSSDQTLVSTASHGQWCNNHRNSEFDL